MGRSAAVCAVLLLAVAPHSCFAQEWKEGTNYVRLNPPQHTSVAPGKVEVTEVFSYGSIVCGGFLPFMKQLQDSLPPTAQLVDLPAAFRADPDSQMFQRAFFAAQALGIAEQTHQAMFNAVWISGELGTLDLHNTGFKNPLPSIEDAARFYANNAGVPPDTFLTAANSSSIDTRMRAADALLAASHVSSVPAVIVNGKYRLLLESLGSPEQLVGLVEYLVAQESPGAQAAAEAGR